MSPWLFKGYGIGDCVSFPLFFGSMGLEHLPTRIAFHVRSMDPSWVCWIGIMKSRPIGWESNLTKLCWFIPKSPISPKFPSFYHSQNLPKNLQKISRNFPDHFFLGDNQRGHLWRVPAPLLWAKWRWPLGLRIWSPEACWSWTASKLAVSNLFSLVVGGIFFNQYRWTCLNRLCPM